MNWLTTSGLLLSSGRRRFTTKVRRKPSAPRTTATATRAMPPSPSGATTS